MTDTDGFRLVKSRNPRRRQSWTVRCSKGIELSSVGSPRAGESEVDVESVKALRRLVCQCCEDLRHSSFLSQLLSTVRLALGIEPTTTNTSGESRKHDGTLLSEVDAADALCCLGNECGCIRLKRIVAYGVGKFSSCITARYQLALLLLLAESLAKCSCGKQDSSSSCPEATASSLAVVPVEAYDPAFDELERLVVADLGINVIGINEEGKRVVAERTLFYMPHCPKALYNNLLWANWDAGRLADTVILGNSFSAVGLAMPSRQLLASFTYLARAATMVGEYRVENNFKFPDVFNDMSVHVFPRQRLLPELLGSRSAEPTYDDEDELILAS